MAASKADKSWVKTEKGKKALKDRWDKRRASGKDKAWNKGLTKETDKRLEIASENNKHYRELGVLSNIGDHMRGKEFTEEHKAKLSEIAKNRPKIRCEFCNEEHIKQMYIR